MIDASIYNNLRPPQFADPAELMGKALQLQAARQQIQMMPLKIASAQQDLESGRLANQKAQTDIDEEKAFKDEIANGATPARLMAVAPRLAVPHLKAFNDQEKAKLDALKEKTQLFANALGSVKYAAPEMQAQQYATVRAKAIQDGIAQPQDVPEQYDPAFVDQHFRAAIDADKQIDDKQKALDFNQRVLEAAPKTAKEWNDVILQEGAGAKSQADLDQTRSRLEAMGVPKEQLARTLPAMWSQAATDNLARRAVPVEKQPGYDIEKMRSTMGLMGNSEYDQFLGAYAQKLGKTAATLSPDEKLKSFTEFAEAKKDPVMRGLAIAQGNLANALRQIQIDGAPTKEDAAMLADDIINHRLAPDQLSTIRGRGNGQLGIMIERELKKVDPKFNWEQAASEFQLAKSPQFQQTVRYMDSVQESIPMVIDRAQKLANGNVRSINSLLNAGRNQFNDVDVKRFKTDSTLVADEIAKILQGGGTGTGTSDAKLKQAGEILNASDSPAAIAAALGDVKQLIGYRRTALTRGTYLEGAQPEKTPAAGGQVKVTDPSGGVHVFNSQAEADNFKKLAGIK